MKNNFWKFIIAGLLLSLALGILISPFASQHPDGLEWVAQEKGFLKNAEDTQPAWDKSVIPDYAFPGVENERIATAAAGLVGVLIMFGVGWGVAHLVAAKNMKSGGKAV